MTNYYLEFHDKDIERDFDAALKAAPDPEEFMCQAVQELIKLFGPKGTSNNVLTFKRTRLH